MAKNKFSDEERQSFYQAILHLDNDKTFVIADKENDNLTYTNRIVSHEKISGRPTDEELTRCLILLQLIKNYDYKPESIEIENSFSIGGRRGDEGARAVETDIVIKNEQGQIEIICEIKKIHDFKGVDDSSIRKQLFIPFNEIVKYNSAKYLFHLSTDVPLNKEQFPLNCIGIDTSITKTYEEWTQQGKTPHLLDLVKSGEKPDIQTVFVKLSGEEQNIQKKFKDLEDDFGIDKIRRVWRTLWDYIWNGNLEDNKKFENFNKVLLAKIYDERKTKKGTAYSFQRKFKHSTPQTDETLAQDVDLLYRKAFREYLSKDKNIELRDIKGIDFKEFSHQLIAKCVELFSPISFHRNRYKNVDILGEFYEMVIRDAFKQTKGLFLTHPNIVLFILSALDIENLVIEKLKYPDEDNRFRLPFVIDPSCGTGTFLVHYMKFVQKLIDEKHHKISEGDSDVIDFIKRQMQGENTYKWVIDYVFGIDNEPVLATACQINMILHGDGSTNIYNTDGLEKFKEYEKLEITGANNILSSNIHKNEPYYSKSCVEKFDCIISNPPFNVNINRSVHENFTVSGKSEAYFLERWYQLLKPNGRIGVVLPESFFAVEEDVNGRIFLYKHFNLKAIVALPNFAFSPHTTTSTSLLFASKKTKEEELIFAELWQNCLDKFNEKYSRFNSLVSVSKADVTFKIEEQEQENSVSKLIEKAKIFIHKEFGIGFAILPYFNDDYLLNIDNFDKVKKKLKDIVKSEEERWVLHQVTAEQNCVFYNFSISEIGYKAGKKGSKDKPNDLMSIYDSEGKKIYNLKYAHSWHNIDAQNQETVLGQLKKLRIWQS